MTKRYVSVVVVQISFSQNSFCVIKRPSIGRPHKYPANRERSRFSGTPIRLCTRIGMGAHDTNPRISSEGGKTK